MPRKEAIKITKKEDYVEVSINRSIRRRYNWAIWTFKVKGNWEFVLYPKLLEQRYQQWKGENE